MQLGPILTGISEELLDERTRWGMTWRLLVMPLVVPLHFAGHLCCWIAFFIAFGKNRWPEVKHE